MNEIIEVTKSVFIGNYANFNGRARRSEYFLYSIGISLILLAAIVPFILFIIYFTKSEDMGFVRFALSLSIFFIAYVAILIPSLAVTVRRLHDLGKSGWWFLLCFVPLGSAVILVFTMLDGEIGANEYGYDPKAKEHQGLMPNRGTVLSDGVKKMLANFKNVFQNNYLNFIGRSSREEFWTFQGVIYMVFVALYIVIYPIVYIWSLVQMMTQGDSTAMLTGMGIFFAIVFVALLPFILPSLAIASRRLHDTGRSATYLLLLLIPLFGSCILGCMLSNRSEEADNQYGVFRP